MTSTTQGLFYLIAAVCFILALKGLSSPRTARNGNLLGAAGALLATVTVASKAPAAPSRLPLRAVRGVDSPLSARMKQTAAIR